MFSNLVRRWCAQMAINAVLIAGVFVAAAYVGKHPPAILVQLALGEELLNTLLWLVAMIIALPLFIATSRKLQALGLLVAETKVSPALADERTAAIRAIVSQVVPIAGSVILGVYALALSSTLLPTFWVGVVLVLVVAVIGWLLRRSFIRVYSRAQVALLDTLAQEAAPRPATSAALPAMLSEADLSAVAISAGSPAAGKLIRELEIRTRTGASIVGIERAGTNILNPGPDEELQGGDSVLLLGELGQLEAARALLGATPQA